MPDPNELWTGRRRLPRGRRDLHFGTLVGHRDDEAMRRFRGYGLGQFLHFGIFSIPGNQWQGVSARDGAPASEWIRSWHGPTAPADWATTYDNLYRQFDPKDFDADRWADQAATMGARYVMLPTKHHDGFCLWPSRFSDYTVANTPYGRDIVGELVTAYRNRGIDIFLYFSILEWRHPDYSPEEPATEVERRRQQRFLDYTRNQLLELVERYPSIAGFWFDGTWDPSWMASYEFSFRLEQELRQRIPGLIIGSRFRNDEYGSRHFDSNGRLLGDYEQGWERKLPATFDLLDGHDWDCVTSIPPNGWGYLKDVTGLYLKTTDDIIEMLLRCRSMNGNLVVNFGPDGEGNMRAEEDTIAREVGAWVRTNHEAIYPARHVDLPPTGYGHYTGHGDALYLTVVNRPVTDLLRIPVGRRADRVPVTATIIGDGRELPVRHSDIGFDLDENTYYDVRLPADLRTTSAFVVRLTLAAPSATAAELMTARM